MLEAGENPRFIFRRMLISAGEDIGLADPQAVVVVEACAAAFERIGLPEGLYPLAQAALYLACAEKSNSTMGLFEAIRLVRSTQNQTVPSHLRDANRDGEAFGDGKGYRYPHAYREHWVAQNYLPDALQGEVFWTPSKQGWEGERRGRMLERRAAQLAVAAEAAQTHPLLLSSGPNLPDMERWLHRQLAQNDERLQDLQQRLWAPVTFQRTDRVLVLGGRSLLWALGPLNAVQDGSVTILCSTTEEQTQLEAQLDLLDPLHRPNLLAGGAKALQTLHQDWRFEVVGGRFSGDDRAWIASPEFWQQLHATLSPAAQLHVLISRTAIGPAAALSEQCPESSEALSELLEKEEQWLLTQQLDQLVQQKLEDLAISVSTEQWQEPLSLPIDERLLKRWLAEDRPYRSLVNRCSQPEKVLNTLEQLLRAKRGGQLSQPLIHQRLACTMPAS
jgi:putative ATPase